MAFSGTTWTPEDDDVGTAVAKTISQGGPLMKQAKGLGMAMANRRGLSNSSIAVGSSQGEVLKAATPIAAQTAGQIAEKNLAALNNSAQYKYGTDLSRLESEAAKERLGMQIESTEGISAADRGSTLTLAQMQDARERDLTGLELGSRERISGSEIASAERMQGTDIASRERLSASDITARMAELQTRISGDMDLARQGDQSAMDRLTVQLAEQARLQSQQIASTEGMQGRDIASREGMQGREITSAETMQGRDIASREGTSAAELAVQREKIASDETMSAADRASALTQLDRQIEGSLTQQRERIAADTSISAADREAELQRLDRDIAARREMTQMQETGQSERLTTQLGSEERRQTQADTAILERQREEIAARKDISEADREAELSRLDRDIAARVQLTGMTEAGATERQALGDSAAAARQSQADTAALTRQREELSTRTDISAADRAAEMTRLDRELASRTELTGMTEAGATARQQSQLDTTRDIATDDRAGRLATAQMEVDANQRSSALTAATSAQGSYMQAYAALMSNPKIPAAARASGEAALKAATDASMRVTEQITGQDLSWGAPA